LQHQQVQPTWLLLLPPLLPPLLLRCALRQRPLLPPLLAAAPVLLPLLL
jgi:hypothetical protein